MLSSKTVVLNSPVPLPAIKNHIFDFSSVQKTVFKLIWVQNIAFGTQPEFKNHNFELNMSSKIIFWTLIQFRKLFFNLSWVQKKTVLELNLSSKIIFLTLIEFRKKFFELSWVQKKCFETQFEFKKQFLELKKKHYDIL